MPAKNVRHAEAAAYKQIFLKTGDKRAANEALRRLRAYFCRVV